MGNTLRWQSFLILAFLLLFANVSCEGSSGETSQSTTPFTVRWGEFNKDIGNLAFYLGLEKGFFRDEGIEIKVFTFPGGPPKMAAVVAGDLDMGTIGPPGIIAASRGAGITFVSSGWTSDIYFFLIGSPDIENIEGLRGGRIAINNYGSGYDLALRVMLKAHALNPEQDVSIVAVGSGPAALAALESGQLSAAVVKEHLLSLAESRQTARLLGASWDYLPEFHQTSIFAADQFTEKHPEAVRRVLNAYWRAQIYALENEEAVIKFGAKFLDVDSAVLKSAWDRFKPHLRTSGEIEHAALQNTVDALFQFGFIEEPIDADSFVDPSYLPGSLPKSSVP